MSRLTSRRPVVDLAAVRAAVGAVHDPELGMTLAEAGLVGDITVSRSGHVRVQLRLTTQGCPLESELTAASHRAAVAVASVTTVDVAVATLSARERAELADRVAASSAPLTGGLGAPAPRILAVASGKGGVGKSTVTANLAAALAASGERVGVLDADVWGYSIPQLFGMRRSPVVLGEKMLPVPAHGVALMSIGFFVADDQPVVWRGPMLHKALSQFVTDTAWGALDSLLVDLPPGTGDATLSVLNLLPDATLLVITTPQATARTVATRVARMAAESGRCVTGVVENMSASVCGSCGEHTALFGTGGGRQLADDVGAPLLGRVPLDVELREAGDRGVPVVLATPQSASARELTRIASALPAASRRSLAGRALPLSVVTR
ncbi:Mrp/NBP35 family ATP-binding protein [Pseudonocardia sp.]|uniref:Mrp/NBP35 family ATP-binding protein n=1 Tax=Pseudonocardia sp. TaxID=60912 RepID=UPI003D0D60B0